MGLIVLAVESWCHDFHDGIPDVYVYWRLPFFCGRSQGTSHSPRCSHIVFSVELYERVLFPVNVMANLTQQL